RLNKHKLVEYTHRRVRDEVSFKVVSKETIESLNFKSDISRRLADVVTTNSDIILGIDFLRSAVGIQNPHEDQAFRSALHHFRRKGIITWENGQSTDD